MRETSRRTFFQAVRNPIPSLKRAFGMTKVEEALSGVVLEKGLETRLSRVAQSTFNTKRNNAPFRHLLLYGTYGRGFRGGAGYLGGVVCFGVFFFGGGGGGGGVGRGGGRR